VFCGHPSPEQVFFKKLRVVLLGRSFKFATQSFADSLLLDRSFSTKNSKLWVVPLDK